MTLGTDTAWERRWNPKPQLQSSRMQHFKHSPRKTPLAVRSSILILWNLWMSTRDCFLRQLWSSFLTQVLAGACTSNSSVSPVRMSADSRLFGSSQSWIIFSQKSASWRLLVSRFWLSSFGKQWAYTQSKHWKRQIFHSGPDYSWRKLSKFNLNKALLAEREGLKFNHFYLLSASILFPALPEKMFISGFSHSVHFGHLLSCGKVAVSNRCQRTYTSHLGIYLFFW